MPFQSQSFSGTLTGEISEGGETEFTVPQFDPSLGTLTDISFSIGGDFEGVVFVNDTTGELSTASLETEVTATLEPGDGSPDFDKVTSRGTDSSFAFLLFSSSGNVEVDGFLFTESTTIRAVEGAVGTGEYTVLAGFEGSVSGQANPVITSSEVDVQAQVTYTYVPTGEGAGEDSNLIPEKTGDQLNGPGGTQRLFVSSIIPTLAPVTPDEPIDWTFSLPQFNPIYGELESASIIFYGSVISTAIINDIFPTGFGAIGTGTVTLGAFFEDAPGGPTIPDAELALIATNSAFFFDLTSLPLNTVNNTDSIPLGNIQGAVGTGTFDVNSSYTGAFLGSPFGSLPQQAFIYGAEVEYIYTAGAGGRPEFLTSGNDVRAGDNGGQFFDGGGGNDSLTGGNGNDTLLGGDGRDFLGGGTGADRMQGGRGNDQYVVDNAGDRVEAEIGFSQGGGIDTVRSFISYTLPSNVEILRLQGNGNINGNGGFAPEVLVGNVGSNRMFGGGGNDRINGKAGDDVLIGALGADTLVGDGGRDIFRFNSVNDSRAGADNRDFINGFQNGQDRINLFEIDANWNVGGNQAYRFIGDNAFTGSAGEVRFFTFNNGNFNIVEADNNGDGRADLQIFVNLTDTMNAGDFIL